MMPDGQADAIGAYILFPLNLIEDEMLKKVIAIPILLFVSLPLLFYPPKLSASSFTILPNPITIVSGSVIQFYVQGIPNRPGETDRQLKIICSGGSLSKRSVDNPAGTVIFKYTAPNGEGDFYVTAVYCYKKDGQSYNESVSSHVHVNYPSIKVISKYGTSDGDGRYPIGTRVRVSVTPNYIEGDGERHILQYLEVTEYKFRWESNRFWPTNSYRVEGNVTFLTMKAGSYWRVTAIWRSQFHVEIHSKYGEVFLNGQPFTSGWLNEGTTLNFSISPTSIMNNASRVVFQGWEPQVDVVASPLSINAVWLEEYYLSVVSEYGHVEGAGWYGKGSVANIRLYPTFINLSKDVRCRFLCWSDGYRNPNRTILVDSPKVLTALWKKLYYVKVSSKYGNTTGTGWYEEGSIVTPKLDISEFVKEDGTKIVFKGWHSSTGSFNVTSPMTIYAIWKPEGEYGNDPPPQEGHREENGLKCIWLTHPKIIVVHQNEIKHISIYIKSNENITSFSNFVFNFKASGGEILKWTLNGTTIKITYKAPEANGSYILSVRGSAKGYKDVYSIMRIKVIGNLDNISNSDIILVYITVYSPVKAAYGNYTVPKGEPSLITVYSTEVPFNETHMWHFIGWKGYGNGSYTGTNVTAWITPYENITEYALWKLCEEVNTSPSKDEVASLIINQSSFPLILILKGREKAELSISTEEGEYKVNIEKIRTISLKNGSHVSIKPSIKDVPELLSINGTSNLKNFSFQLTKPSYVIIEYKPDNYPLLQLWFPLIALIPISIFYFLFTRRCRKEYRLERRFLDSLTLPPPVYSLLTQQLRDGLLKLEEKYQSTNDE